MNRRLLIAIELAVGVSAVVGGGYLMAAAEPFPYRYLDGTPFGTFVLPGMILAIVVGCSQFAAALVLALREPSAGRVALAAAVVLLGWVLGELWLVGMTSWLQPFALVLALWSLFLAWRLAHVDEPGRSA